MTNISEHPFHGAPVIHAYSRAQAISDGVLVAVPAELAREAGFVVPVAMTASAWADMVTWVDDDNHPDQAQDEDGRLWDVLITTRYGISRNRRPGSTAWCKVMRVPSGRKDRVMRPASHSFKVHAGPGDAGEQVLTIMEPGES